MPFKTFIDQFGIKIGISDSEREGLFANQDSYAGAVEIKPVDKKDAEAIMQRLIEVNA